MDRGEDLKKYTKQINDISADDVIKNNSYDPIQFYGVILCYLDYYAHDNFNKILEHLLLEKANVLYEIMLIYFSHFILLFQSSKIQIFLLALLIIVLQIKILIILKMD